MYSYYCIVMRAELLGTQHHHINREKITRIKKLKKKLKKIKSHVSILEKKITFILSYQLSFIGRDEGLNLSKKRTFTLKTSTDNVIKSITLQHISLLPKHPSLQHSCKKTHRGSRSKFLGQP